MGRTREEILRIIEEQEGHKRSAQSIISHTNSPIARDGAYEVIANVDANIEALKEELAGLN